MRIEKTLFTLIFGILCVPHVISNSDIDDFEQGNHQKYVIEGKHSSILIFWITLIKIENSSYSSIENLFTGKVYNPELMDLSENNWQRETVISINGGEQQAFLKEDGK